MAALKSRRGVLELLDRAGRVEQRVTVDEHPLRIGRAYDNDLILEDAYVSPHHARIALDTDSGRLLLRDLDSTNGIRVASPNRRVHELVLDAERMFELGLTQLRYRTVDYMPPEALPLRLGRHPLNRLTSACALLLVCLATLGLDALFDSTEAFGVLKLVNAVLPPLLVILLWAGIWALIGRLLLQRASFYAHLAVVAAGLLLGSLAEIVCNVGAFALSLDRLISILDAAAFGAMVAAIVYGHLRFATRLAPRSATIAALTCGLLLAGASQIKERVVEQQFYKLPRFTLVLYPPGLRLTRASSTAAFFARVHALESELDSEPPVASNANR